MLQPQSTTSADPAFIDSILTKNLITQNDTSSIGLPVPSTTSTKSLLPTPPCSLFDGIAAGVIFPLAVSFITWFATRFWERRNIQKKVDAAPRIYVRELDSLIKRAMIEGPTNAVINARAIITARNSLRGSLVSISSQLNSEIDRLASDIGIAERNFSNRMQENTASRRAAFATIEVLSRVWPAKKRQIVIEMRKVLTELGFDPSTITDSEDDSDSRNDYQNPSPGSGPIPSAPVPVEATPGGASANR